jgi:3D (Asp-Asp-Asp) domain-containing protein
MKSEVRVSRKRKFSRYLLSTALLAVVVMLIVIRVKKTGSHREEYGYRGGDASTVLVTGYCNCGKCCGWERSWFGFGEPVYNYGRFKGKPKKVGVTASGKTARHGTVAADPAVFGFGTRLEIPGYGIGVVEDIGGAIKGRHIDIWFPCHAAAKRWGVKKLKVKVLNR